ncbi:amino acid adenylation domain-containing protein [Streptomyces sp. MST-110588]|uniref:non-ribosomal peptide synthetase n=1 Tax=Streptomyces sp. MST-110588 TaxID=2833628 RepID=UPI002414160B|nr:amino acid adenylation domain-containing protein [Streptomyces sp. MST-110588]
MTRRAAQWGVTLNSMVETAWALLLAHLTGRADVVFGVTVAGRPAELQGAADLVGLFVNTVPLRVRIDPGERLGDLVTRVQSERAELLDHQHLGLSDIEEAVGAGRLFDTALAFENYPLDAAGFSVPAAGVRVESVEVHDGTHYPLSLAVLPRENRLVFRLRLREGALSWPGDAAELGELLLACCAALAAADDGTGGGETADGDTTDGNTTAGNTTAGDTTDGDTEEQRTGNQGPGNQGAGTAGRLSLLSAEHRRTVLGWGTGPDPDPAVRNQDAPEHPFSLPAAFEAVVARHPGRVALWSQGQEITYGELDARANRLARHLARGGAGFGTPVAVESERSPEVAVAYLALAKLGAVCVPLHPGLPPERRQWILRHTGTELTLDDLPAAERAARAEPAKGPGTRVPPSLTACVIFTSGSSGLPKGVALTHGNILTRALDPLWRGPEHERVLFHSPHAWDMGLFEVWMPLLTGRRSVVAPAGDLEPADYRRVIEAGGVTSALLTAGLFDVIAQECPQALRGLRAVAAGGDVLPPAAVRRARRAAPGLRVFNLYGPVETTAYAAGYEVPAGPAQDPRPLPVGGPAPGTRVLLLDPALRPVPPGVPGEIHLAGGGTAQGYLGGPGRTAERFVADPYGPPGSRMYRTGDLGRWDSAGRLHFLGRTDRQLKVNGFRIEPGEIEAALSREPGVGVAAVVARGTGPSGKALIGYVVPDGPLDTGELRAGLAAKLPAHMVPATLITLDALPLTRNGKVDTAALPAPEPGGTAAGARPVRPASRCWPRCSQMCSACPTWASRTTSSRSAAIRSPPSGSPAGSAPNWAARCRYGICSRHPRCGPWNSGWNGGWNNGLNSGRRARATSRPRHRPARGGLPAPARRSSPSPPPRSACGRSTTSGTTGRTT